MSKERASDKTGSYGQRALEQPVQKVIDDKLSDPGFATKKGERDATEVLQEGVAKSLGTQHSWQDSSGAAGRRTEETGHNLMSAIGQSLKDQPMATLAIVGAFSFLLGALWRS